MIKNSKKIIFLNSDRYQFQIWVRMSIYQIKISILEYFFSNIYYKHAIQKNLNPNLNLNLDQLLIDFCCCQKT